MVVGGGIVGAASAFYLGRSGLDVLLLEEKGALAALNTTRSLEAFRAQFDDADDIAMMRESIRVFENFADEIGVPGYDISLRQQGYLFVSEAEDGEARLQARVARQHEAGLTDVEYMPGGEARRRFPYLSESVTAACFRARDGWLASHEVTYGFAQAAPNTRVWLDTAVQGVEVTVGTVTGVRTARGSVQARQVVLAAGPYSLGLAAAVGVDLPMMPVRRHRAGIRAHPLIPRQAPMTLSLDTGAHWRPEGAGAYFGFSGALEEAADVARDVVLADPLFPALAIDAVGSFCPFFSEIAASLRRDNVTVQAGQYDLTPDAKPLIGPAAGGPLGLWLNTGYSGHGVMGSPAGGRLLAALMTGRTPSGENPFRPSRFDERAVVANRPL